MSTATNRDSAPAAIAEAPLGNLTASRLTVWSPYLLAVFFTLSALRGVSSTDVIDTDAARHAMNGAFIYDMVRGGHLGHPLEYSRQYYSHLPALSMPYHPPLFPAMESLFYAAFGVNLLGARLAVATSAGLCSLLLYKLVHATLDSRIIAACVTLTTWSLWTSQVVARDVMLECPSMVFALAALYCARDLDGYTMRRALFFAIFAVAAVWTKQHAVFVGAVPLLQAVFSQRWKLFRKSPIWVSSAIFGAGVLALTSVAKQFNRTGLSLVTTSAGDTYGSLAQTMPDYFRWVISDVKGLPGVFAVGTIAAFLVLLRKPNPRLGGLGLYAAWIVAMSAVLMILRVASPRYLFFIFPAAITIGYILLIRAFSSLWEERRAAFAVAGFAFVWFVAGFFVPVEFLRGPAASAAVVVQGSPTRVVYAGDADGNFTFAVRSLDSQLQTTVIPGEKLPPTTFEPKALEAFCHQFGIDWVILENGAYPHAWSNLRNAMPASLQLERSIPLESSRLRWTTGTIDIYRFTGSKGEPGGVLNLPVRKLGGTIGLKL
jgi:4-amino-4-deoxy-L-arabinose transferase-like glycosyltransferase